QTLGDPRGELIALDLHGVGSGVARRRELLLAWLGGGIRVWRDDADGMWYAGDPDHTWATFDRGFMEIVLVAEHGDAPVAAVRGLLASPAGPYLRRMSIAGSDDSLRTVLTDLAARPRPWLRYLAIRDERDLDDLLAREAAFAKPIVDAVLHEDLCD